MIADFVLILKAEFKRDLIFMKRYPLEPLSFLFFMYLILMSIILGLGQLVPGGALTLNKEKMIIGYCLMQFVLSAQMGWSGQISNESQTGTLEQLSISGHTLGGVLLSRGLSQFPRHALSFFMLLGAYRLTLPQTGLRLTEWMPALLLLFIMGFGIFGVAYLFAGLTLIFKRVGFFFQIINFGFLGLFWQDRGALAAGGVAANLYDWFPLTVGMASLQNTLGSTSAGAEFSLVWLTFVSLLWMAGGFAIFFWLEREARKRGLLSQY